MTVLVPLTVRSLNTAVPVNVGLASGALAATCAAVGIVETVMSVSVPELSQVIVSSLIFRQKSQVVIKFSSLASFTTRVIKATCPRWPFLS